MRVLCLLHAHFDSDRVQAMYEQILGLLAFEHCVDVVFMPGAECWLELHNERGFDACKWRSLPLYSVHSVSLMQRTDAELALPVDACIDAVHLRRLALQAEVLL